MTDQPALPPRESMEFDVVIVGAGPAGLAAAIRIKQLNPETSVVVMEKGFADWSDGYLQAPSPWLVDTTWHMWFNAYTYDGDAGERIGLTAAAPHVPNLPARPRRQGIRASRRVMMGGWPRATPSSVRRTGSPTPSSVRRSR